jgi:hypothetical protein
MLDENLPTFFLKPVSDDPFRTAVFLGQGGHDLQPEYFFRRPDSKLPQAQNRYALALYDSYNPDILYAEVLVEPEWTQPTLSQAEIRANNGQIPPPVPIVPNTFTIELYNPDQQVQVRQIAGSAFSSAYWEFEMPERSFRQPSASSLDAAQSDPAQSAITPKVTFKWKRDSKLSKDITCYMVGKSTDGKKSKEPDITVAMFVRGKELTLYEPNMHRVEVEDRKGLEEVILLSSAVIRDVFLNASRETFNMGPSVGTDARRRKSSGAIVIGGGKHTPPAPAGAVAPAPVMHGAVQPAQARPQPTTTSSAPTKPTQWEVDQETARLKAQLEAEQKERERQERHDRKKLKQMLESEEKERRRQEAEVAKETERLRRQYGINPVPDNMMPQRPTVHFTPALPPRPEPQFHGPPPPVRPPDYGNPNAGRQRLYAQAQPLPPQALPQYFSAPHSRPPPVQRPVSTSAAQSGPFPSSTLNNVSPSLFPQVKHVRVVDV